MMKGSYPRIIEAEAGQVLGISTGFNACQEHNINHEDLQRALTVLRYGIDDEIIAGLRAGEHVNLPHILERMRLVKNLDQIQFREISDGDTPEALIGYCEGDITDHLGQLQIQSNQSCAGAWDNRSFAFRVRGMQQVMQLKDLYRQMTLGNTCFASCFAFYDGEAQLDGVTIMVVDRLYPKYQEAVAQTQSDYLSKLRLKAASRESELRQFFYRGKTIPGFIWPMWKDDAETEVVYGFNPGAGVKADYCGPYTFYELKVWAEAGCGYHLKPSTKEETP